MSMVEAITAVFKNYAKFDGRARRSEFWWYALALTIGYFALSILGSVLVAATRSDAAGGVLGIVYLIAMLALIVPTISVTVRPAFRS